MGPPAKSKLEFATLPANAFSLGLAVRFLSQYPPFADFKLGKAVKAITQQIGAGHHLVGAIDDQLKAYLGWVRTDTELAEAWIAGSRRLTAKAEGAAIAVTMLAVDDPALIFPMIREAKRRNLGVAVYWKRLYTGGRPAKFKVVRKRGDIQ